MQRVNFLTVHLLELDRATASKQGVASSSLAGRTTTFNLVETVGLRQQWAAFYGGPHGRQWRFRIVHRSL